MKVLWKSDLGQSKHDPLEITHVVTKTGSHISADLVVALEPHPVDRVVEVQMVDALEEARTEADGLLEVIDAQLAAIDELTQSIKIGILDAGLAKDHADLQEWADQFPILVENLCMALGYARNPVGPTGIPELDVLVGLSR